METASDYLEGAKVVLEESHNMRPVNYSLYGSIVLFILLHIRYLLTYLSLMVGWFQVYLLFVSLIVYKRAKLRQDVDYGQQLRQQTVQVTRINSHYY